jgi:single-strand DNA-binding protein
MMGQATVTVIGNITNEPELRFTPSGVAVVTFSVADNPRKKNQQSGQYENGESTFYRVQAWRQQAENIAESFNKGDRVVVVGELQNRRYETQDGGVRFSLEINANAVAADTRFATVQIRKPDRTGGQQNGQQPQQQGYQQAPPSDPWDTGAPQQQGYQQPRQPAHQGAPQGDPWGSAGGGQQPMGFSDEPPFNVSPAMWDYQS